MDFYTSQKMKRYQNDVILSKQKLLFGFNITAAKMKLCLNSKTKIKAGTKTY